MQQAENVPVSSVQQASPSTCITDDTGYGVHDDARKPEVFKSNKNKTVFEPSEFYNETIRAVNLIFGRTALVPDNEKATILNLHGRLGKDRICQLALTHKAKVMEKSVNQNHWAYFRGILQRQIKSPNGSASDPESAPTELFECRLCSKPAPVVWIKDEEYTRCPHCNQTSLTTRFMPHHG